MKKIKFLILLLPLLSGCYNYRELNELGITTAVSIDYKDNNFYVIAEVINPIKQQDASSSNNSPFVNYNSSSSSLQDAFRKVVLESPRQLYAAQLEIIVLSEEVVNNHLEEVLEYFARIELGYYEATNEVIVPSFRQDLHRMADLAEEVARFYGYDNIPVTLPNGESTAGKKPFKIRVEDVCRNVAEQNGFCGGMTYSFESPKVFDKLLLAEDAKERQAIEISNPLGEDFSIMRTVSLNGMLKSLSTNLAHRNKNVRLYEFGNIYIPKALPLTELPDERMQMTLGMYGECDFFTLKGVVEDMLDSLGLGGRSEYAPTGEHPFLHPGRAADVTIDGEKIAYIGQIHPEVMDNYNMKGEVYVAVIDMPTLVPKATFDRKYEGVAKFPAMKRDLSMVMKKDIFVGQLEKIFKDKGGKLLESYELFDVYEGDQIEKGYKSVAYSLTFRAKDRTLEDAEVSKIVEKILDELKKLGVELRA